MVSYNNTSFHSHGNPNQQPPINQQHQFLSVQKLPSKPSKKPPSSAAPPASTKPKVYNVKPIHFRELVQRLTGTSQSQSQHQLQPPSQWIQSAPPPPRSICKQYPYRNECSFIGSRATGSDCSEEMTDGFMVGDGVELSLSPSSCSWFSFPLLSPGPQSNFGA